MLLKGGTYNMTDAGMQWGLGIGCTIAILLMIVSCVYFIKELYEYCTYVPSPPPSLSPPLPIERRTDGPCPTPSGNPISDKPPPPYHIVVSIPPTDDSFIRHDRSPPNPIRPYIPAFDRRSPSLVRPVDSLPEVDVCRPIYPSTVAEVNCLLPVCREYFQSLQLQDIYFKQQHDCYCIKCCPNNSQTTRRRGGYAFTIPYGWIRFRIATDRAQAQQKKIFQSWATSYYGTCEEKLEQILRNRPMPLPGDVLTDDAIFSDHSGFEKQWLTSPSINYASDLQYSPIKTFISNRTGEIYNAQVVLQCKQEPETFVIQPGRPGLCNIIPTNEIEWKSKRRSTLIPIGLMIRMVKR